MFNVVEQCDSLWDRLWNALNGFHEQMSILCITVTLGLCGPILGAFRRHSPKPFMKCSQTVCVWGFEGKKKGLAGNVAVKLRRERVQHRTIKYS